MSEGAAPPSGCGHLGILSLIASLLGSALAAAVFAAINSQIVFGAGMEAAAHFLFGVSFIFFFGIFIGLPVGLAVGIPLLALTRRSLLSRVVIATLVFAVLGLLGGLALQNIGGNAGLGNAMLVFGACIGGMHPLVYGRANGAPWFKIMAALLLSAAAVPSLAYVGEDVANLLDSQTEFERRCADHYGSMAVIADRAALERHGNHAETKGKWYKGLRWRSLYEREDIVPLDNAHVLIARDYAYVPSGFAGWITGGQRVERHCLSEKKGTEADMLRDRGFGKRPRLQDLIDWKRNHWGGMSPSVRSTINN